MYPDVPAVFCDTGLEYPEVREHVFSTPNVVILRPKMDFRSVVKKYGYPVISKNDAGYIHELRHTFVNESRKKKYLEGLNMDGSRTQFAFSKMAIKCLESPFEIGNQCCNIMKKYPVHKYEREVKGKSFVGVMAEESRLRSQSFVVNGCNVFNLKRPMSRPLMTWQEQDVLHYIKHEGLKIPSVYGEIVPALNGDDTEGQCAMFDDDCKLTLTGVSRTGCMFCGFGVHLEKEPNRFQRMKKTHPKIYEYCMRPWDKGGLGLAEVLDFIGVKY